MGCSLPVSSVPEILKARIVECVAIDPLSHTSGRFFNFWATKKAQEYNN